MQTSQHLLPFEHPSFGKIRVIMKDGTDEPWFVAKDIAMVLGLLNIRQNLNELDSDEKGVCSVYTPGGNQEMNTVSESGLYALIFRSKKQEAHIFRKWVTSEVLPAIRKHGGYLTPSKVEEVLLDPDTIIRLATALKEERAAKLQIQAALEEAQPKAKIVDAAFSKRSQKALKVYELARKMDGLNAACIKRDLKRFGYFYYMSQQYRVRSQYRGNDRLFIEKEDPVYFKHEIYATAKGAALITQLYYEKKLTMKKGYTL